MGQSMFRGLLLSVFVLASAWLGGCGGDDDSGFECSASQWSSSGFTETYSFKSGNEDCSGGSTYNNTTLNGRDDTDSTWDCRVDSETFSNNNCTRNKTSSCYDPFDNARVYTTSSVITQRDAAGDFYDGTSTLRLDAFGSYPSCTTVFDVTYERE